MLPPRLPETGPLRRGLTRVAAVAVPVALAGALALAAFPRFGPRATVAERLVALALFAVVVGAGAAVTERVAWSPPAAAALATGVVGAAIPVAAAQTVYLLGVLDGGLEERSRSVAALLERSLRRRDVADVAVVLLVIGVPVAQQARARAEGGRVSALAAVVVPMAATLVALTVTFGALAIVLHHAPRRAELLLSSSLCAMVGLLAISIPLGLLLTAAAWREEVASHTATG